MRWFRALLLGVAITAAALLTSQAASAHVLLMDTKGSVGAILHVMPDDNPVAGEPSDMYFDRQGAGRDESAAVTLAIKNSQGEVSEVEVQTNGSLSTATYTFPEQGVYQLTFAVKSDEGEFIFEQSQRVTRGVISSSLEAPQYYWAEALMIGALISFAALLIIAFNRRKEIAKQSTF